MSKSQVKGKALQLTRERQAASVRKGCNSTNLDWLKLVAQCREEYTERFEQGGVLYVSTVWIDTVCPKVIDGTFFVEVDIRDEPYYKLQGADHFCRSRYITFRICE